MEEMTEGKKTCFCPGGPIWNPNQAFLEGSVPPHYKHMHTYTHTACSGMPLNIHFLQPYPDWTTL